MLVNRTRVPGGTVNGFGLTPAEVMVMVMLGLGVGLGPEGVLPLPPPQLVKSSPAAA